MISKNTLSLSFFAQNLDTNHLDKQRYATDQEKGGADWREE